MKKKKKWGRNGKIHLFRDNIGCLGKTADSYQKSNALGGIRKLIFQTGNLNLQFLDGLYYVSESFYEGKIRRFLTL